MENLSPLVTVIIPSFNQGRYISETLRSCLAQDHRPLEVLVLDGGSTDETVGILSSFDAPELRWWSEPDRGVVDAVNKGLERAHGSILTIQSSDDTFLPGAVSSAVEVIEHDPSLGLVYGDVELMNSESDVIGADIQGAFILAEYLGRLSYVPQPGAFFTRHALATVGPWRDRFSYAADADFWMRVATRFPVRKVDRLVGRYRYHANQRDTQRARVEQDWTGAISDLLVSSDLDAVERRAAKMGICLARYRYAAESDWITRTLALYSAVICNPKAVVDRRFPKRDLIPGREPIWRLLSCIKRKMGFRPRAT